MGTYVTEQGFQGKSLQTIKGNLQAGYRAIFGNDFDLSEEKPDGQVIGLFADGLAQCWEGLREVHASFAPSGAVGTSLDRVAAYTGVSRIAASATIVKAMLYTDATNLGVVIPSGSGARRVRGALAFSLTGDVTIATASCQDLYLGFNFAPAPGTVLTLVTTFGTFTSTVNGTGSMLQALKDLAADIRTSAWYTTASEGYAGVVQVWNAGVLEDPSDDVVGGVQNTTDLLLRLVHRSIPFGATAGTWKVLLCGAQGSFACGVTGPNTVGPGELSAIVTPQTGWVGLYNLIQGATGRNTETAAELRIRREAEQGQGYATEQAILKAVYDGVQGVSSVGVVSNRGDIVDSAGRDPHSVEVSLVGGTPQEIAEAIWSALPAGVKTVGTSSFDITDSQGFTQTIRYSNPTQQVVWVRVTFSTYSEETFPGTGVADIKAAVAAWCAANLTTGKDVIGSRICGAVYAAVPGIGNMVISVSGDGVAFTPTLAVDSSHYAFVDVDHVTTVVV